jgi:hypothetical protein
MRGDQRLQLMFYMPKCRVVNLSSIKAVLPRPISGDLRSDELNDGLTEV